jgi:hypothetical protein
VTNTAVTSIVTNVRYGAQTKNAFPLVEAAKVADLLLKGASLSQIRSQVIEEDLFQLRSHTSRSGMLRSVLNYVEGLSEEYLMFLSQGDLDLKRFTLLFLTLKHNRLLRELIGELLLDKVKRLELTIQSEEIKAFFAIKREQNTVLTEWSDSTFQKATSNTVLILVRSGVLKPLSDQKKYEICAFPVPTPLRQQLLADGLEQYLPLLLNWQPGL